ncbi:uncharacterized protein LOC125674085 isoform X2 [Ostrea edulis]|uniref:uncharacterized protein LOC125674085 isoform X2 n=1 Tax=Ostrea edulis TaxID=37623 RepID=UPI0024AE9574|nr:uncharacterized protein LOC125674085 isoform X2 [Ostrea edulis]
MEDVDIYENVPDSKSSGANDRSVNCGYVLMTDKKCIKCQLKGNPSIKCKCQEQAEQGNETDFYTSHQGADYENMKVTRAKNMEKIETLKKQALENQANKCSKAEMRIYDNPEEGKSGCPCTIL